MSKVQIAELVQFRRGISWSAIQEHREPGPGRIPVLTIPNVQDELDTRNLIYLSGVNAGMRDRAAASKGWLLLVGSNGNPARIGNVVLVDEESDYLFASFLVGVKPDQNRVYDRYLLRVLKSEQIKSHLRVTVRGSTGLQNINLPALAGFHVDLPALPEQRRIAEILDTLDDQIRATEQIIAKMRLAKAGLIDNLLTCGINENGTVRSAQEVAANYDSPSRYLPRTWELAECRELCRDITVGIVVRPTQYYRPSGIPMLRSANVRAEGLELTDLVYMSPADHALMSKSGVGPGDLVTVRTGYPGTTSVVTDDLPTANCIDIIVSRPGPGVLPAYLALWVNSEFGKGQVLRNQGGLAQQHFNVSEMKTLQVALPTMAEQKMIVEKVDQINRRLSLEIEQRSKLDSLKSGLMSDLLTGQVRVPVEATA